MQLIDGRPVYSATDLVGFLECEHLTNLERAAVAGLVDRPVRADPELDRIQKRGFQHEARFLEDRRAEGLAVVEVARDETLEDRGERLRDQAARTRAAMLSGADLIYQATFFDGTWLGFADFLRRVEQASAIGAWSYEPWDTKLAHHTKGSAVLQLCLYADLLGRVQGRDPDELHVALGGSARQVDHFRFVDYAAYYRTVRARFLAFQQASPPTYPPPTRPDPVEHCDVCRWSMVCTAERRRTDDLSLVAGITARQRRTLREHEVSTRRALGGLGLPLDTDLVGKSRPAFTRVREQARLQVAGDAVRPDVLYELVDPARTRSGALEPDRGLLSLPDPSPGDLFFDMEGDPFALDDGVDYLFGVLEPGLVAPDGGPTFHAIWGLEDGRDVSAASERRAFEQTIDLFIDRLAKDPDLHIYHYAPYEPTAMGRLMGRYGTRELEVDRLLRGGVFVDLFRAVRQGIRASVESYSIKRLEPLYGFQRQIDLRDAGSSIVAFETWLELGGEVADDPAILERIEAYNRDDCVSNHLLRDWLEGRRGELAGKLGEPLPRPVTESGEASPTLSEGLAQVAAVAARLSADADAPEPPEEPLERARWLLAQLLSWHRREEKSTWWRFFHLLDDLTDEERVAEPDALGMLTYEGIVGEEKQSLIHRFRFPPQDHGIGPGTQVRFPPGGPAQPTGTSPGTVVEVDDEACFIDIKRARTAGTPEATSLIPLESFSTDAQQSSLLRIGDWVAGAGVDGPGRYRAARDLLLRRRPRTGDPAGAALTGTDGSPAEAARRLVVSLDESCLAIQGPPGSGKTTLAGQMITDLVAAGKRVGVTANSHKVIGNLLDKAADASRRLGVAVRLGQKPAQGEPCTCSRAQCLEKNEDVREALANGVVDVVGGTPWLWAREEMEGLVDVLFIDEAGQMSLANALAVAPAGASLVLLGDPQQLDQPLKGAHPPGAERSALGHVLGERETMPPELGLFLDRTWRLHPSICAATSELFYDSKLESYPGRERQDLRGAGPLSSTGIRFIEVRHDGDANESDEEADVVARLIRELLAASPTWVDPDGHGAPVRIGDVLVITPYNAQVGALRRALPGINAGTVDKFQGQEQPISIYSMATSSIEEAPRGMEFLYSLNRLNVATSRARCVTAIVASPELLRVRCRTPRQMRLANALARMVERSTEPAPAAPVPDGPAAQLTLDLGDGGRP